MKNKKLFKLISATFLFTFLVSGFLYPAISEAQILKIKAKANTENSVSDEIQRLKPILHDAYSKLVPNAKEPGTEPTSRSAVAEDVSQSGLGPNLILNPSFETMNASGGPANWGKGGWGTNNRSLTYPVLGNGDTKAAKVTITTYTNGDGKWFFDDVSVTAGKKYEVSDYSISDVPSIITIRYKMTDNSYIYKDVLNVNPSTSYQKNTVQITVPQNAVSLTVFHLINSLGTLTTDTYSLNEVLPQSTTNLVPNGNFESSGTGGLPDSWKKGGWGTNDRQYIYPASGVGGSKGVKVNIGNFTNGDAKWFFTPLALGAGVYTYSDQYVSNVPSLVTIQYENQDGTFTYKDILSLPPAAGFSASSVKFSVGNNIKSVTVFHLIESAGNLTIDNVSVVKSAENTGIFSTGAVTLRFDDGWLSQFQNAIPKMNSLGFKGDFYFITQQMADNGFSDYMSIAQVKQIFTQGHEVGAHTRTHPYLSTISPSAQQNEIEGSRSDILSWNAGPVLSFAYPFGDYSTTTIQFVKNAGFKSALSTLNGYATPTSDRYQLERFEPTNTTTLAQMKTWVDNALLQKQWLIISFHQVDNSGAQYSVTPALFNQIIDYIASKQIPVVTVSQALQSLGQ